MIVYSIPDNVLSNVDSPALLIYSDIVNENILSIGDLLGGYKDLRPHIKTDKNVETIRLLQAHGISKYKCASIAEAEMLGSVQAEDVLLAYQPNKVKAKRLFELVVAYPATHFACLVDNVDTLAMLACLAIERNKVLSVYVDINVGMNRSGITTERVEELWMEAKKYPSLKMEGLHVYDGHIGDTDVHDRAEKAKAIFDKISVLRLLLEQRSGSSLSLIMAGSPTFNFYHRWAKEQEIPNLDVSPGTFTYWDAGYATMLPDLPFRSAVIVLCRILSILDGHVLCLDLGYKSVASENPIESRVRILNVPDAKFLVQSEEHLTIQVPDTSIYKVGMPVYVIPWHVCPTVALYDTAYVVSRGEIVDTWEIVARKRKINF